MDDNTNTNEEAQTQQEQTQTQDQKASDTQQKPAEADKKYSDKDLNDIIAKKQAKWERDAQEKVSEAQKLAKMNADEKAKYELEKTQEDLAKREAEITKRELTATTKEELVSKELPLELAEILNYSDADSVKSSMAAVEKAFRGAVEKQVNEKLKGSAPKTGTTTANPEVDLFRLGAGLKSK